MRTMDIRGKKGRNQRNLARNRPGKSDDDQDERSIVLYA